MASSTSELSERAYEEICRAFELFRIAQMNQRYYGVKASRSAFRGRFWGPGAALVGGACSAFSIYFSNNDGLRVAFSFVAFVTGLLAAVLPFLPTSESYLKWLNLHNEYGKLAERMKALIANMNRERIAHFDVTEEQIQKLKILQEFMTDLKSQDDPDPDLELLKTKQNEVIAAFPEKQVWNF
jgi:hypothetical protein